MRLEIFPRSAESYWASDIPDLRPATAIGILQLVGLLLSQTPYDISGLGLFLPIMFAEWLITPLLLFANYEWPGSPLTVSYSTLTVGDATTGSFIQFGTKLLGLTYTVFGVLGFLPIRFLNPIHHEGIGARYLFNLVAINTIHNLIHLAIGITGILAARLPASARVWRRVCGPTLLLVFLGGMVQAYFEGLPADQLFLGLVPLNSPGHILHLVTGSITLYIGLASPLTDLRK